MTNTKMKNIKTFFKSVGVAVVGVSTNSRCICL